MKKVLLVLLSLFLFFSFSYAGGAAAKATVVRDTSEVLLSSTPASLVKIVGIGDVNNNTSTTRALHFYDAACCTCAAHSNYVFSITFTPGVAMIGDIIDFDITYQSVYKRWGGIDFSSGIVVSGTANNTVNGIFLIQK